MNKIKTNKKVLETVNICSNEVPNQEKELVKITGLLTSRIEKREKNSETYYYGFFKTEGYEQEIPVIFKKVNLIFFRLKHLKKDSRVQLEGTWSQGKERPSFTCSDFKVISDPPQPTLKSLQKSLQPLLATCLEKKSEWNQRTDFFFKKRKELEEIERMAKLGNQFLHAYLLTKQAFYANYQTEHLEQANFSLETYLARINSELERESSQVQAYLRKEVK